MNDGSKKNMDSIIITQVLNKLDALIYITDLKTDEILFINEKMMSEFNGAMNMIGRKCWRTLQSGFEERCPFCPKHKLIGNPESQVVWEEYSTVTGKYYKNTDCIIKWIDGRDVHLQHSVDISDMKLAQNELNKRLAQQELMSALAQSFVGVGEIEKRIADALKKIGLFMDVDLVYLAKDYPQECRFACFSDWHSDAAVFSGQEETSYVGQEDAYRALKESDISEISDFSQVNRKEYIVLKCLEVMGRITVPIYIKKKFWGFLGIVTFEPNEWNDSDRYLAKLLSGVFSMVLEREAAEHELSAYRSFLEHEVEAKIFELRRTKENILDTLSSIVEFRDIVSGQHTKRTSALTQKVINNLLDNPNYTPELEGGGEVIVRAAPVHDIGKIAVPDSILQKPGRLTPEEFEEVKKHSVIGSEIIDLMKDSLDEIYYRNCRDICLYHHERWDGKGYPNGLAGKEIPLAARILSVVDVYDALVSERPYKKAFDHESALRIISESAGTQFDPEIVEALLSVDFNT